MTRSVTAASGQADPVYSGSTLYNFVPNVIPQRLRPTAFLRKRLSRYLRSDDKVHDAKSVSSGMDSKSPVFGLQLDGMDTPRMRPGSSSTTSSSISTIELNEADPGMRSVARRTTMTIPDEKMSDISWKYAYQGSNFLANSMQEAVSSDQDPQLTRKLYVDAMVYLAQALPDELDESETLRLKQAMRADDDTYPVQTTQRRLVSTAETSADDTPDRQQRTLTYMATTTAAFYAMVLFNLLLPLLRQFLLAAIQYERKYKVSERLAASGISVGGMQLTSRPY